MSQEDPRILELREKRAKAMQGGGEDRIAKQHAKGKQTARERIDLLLDSGSFQEIDTFMVSRVEDVEKFAGDGVVTGYGLVDGLMVYVYAQDFTVLGGALGEMQGRKICQVMDMAVKSGVPIIGLIDSGGARIQEGVHSLSGYAEIFRRNAQYSGIIPQISLVLGPCAGGASYSPALTDLIIMVEKQSYMFLTGPEVIKSVTGEVVDSETLGGATAHLTQSGLASLTCPDEQSALDLCRRILGYLPPNHVERPPSIESADDMFRMDDSLNTIVPLDPAEAYSMHEVVEKVVDQGSWLEIQPGFADNALVGLARLGGIPVGILAQEPSVKAGCIDMDAADKMTRFVRFCDCFNLPLVTFVDSPGFLPGVDQEHRGIIRHGAKLLYAYSEATAPKISIITRKAYGGAYIVMNSKPLGADLAFAWPSAEIAVMGAEGAANILYRRQIDAAPDPAAERARLVEEYRQRFLSPYAAAGMGYVDEVIEPRETRARLITALTVLRDKAVTVLPKRHGNMPV
ncbi:MAG: acyl-CoA carboxylase subunit beta [Chloroflexi bacterium]|nr:acyl-CoA carboxylase subunit beta [Chloroflexota bacterium]